MSGLAARQRAVRASPAAGHARYGTGEDGQATVELVAMLPVVLLVAFGIAWALAVGQARELAQGAATAGAAALLQDGDPVAEARAALPDWPARRMRVQVRGRRVDVRLHVRGPAGLGLGATRVQATADAGPEEVRR